MISRCPHCRKLLLSPAQRHVLRLASKGPVSIAELALAYATKRGGMLSCRSSRKAIERLATDRLLVRVGEGLYRTSKRYRS